jgi:hypothetical protein
MPSIYTAVIAVAVVLAVNANGSARGSSGGPSWIQPLQDPKPSTPPSPPPGRPDPGKPGAPGGTPGRLTGCLKAGSGSASYELTNVKQIKPSDTPTGSGRSTAGSSTSSGTSTGSTQTGSMPLGTGGVTLVANPAVDLTPQVGHMVEVTGDWDAGAAKGGTATAGSTSGSAAGKTFRVTQVKMISSACSDGSGGR